MQILSAAVPPFMKNGFVVSCEETREAIVIDPGDEVDELIDGILAGRLTPRAILLTHAHVDHVTGVGRVKAAFDIPTWMHRDDQWMYDNAVDFGAQFGLDVDSPPPVDAYFKPGVPFRFGKYVVHIAHTPGHCPGGVCLAIGREADTVRELFVGDTLFAGSVGRTDLPGGDHELLLRSIREVLFAYPDDAIVHPGHGPDTTIGRERRSNPFLT
jgi:hydroxyacylglutathione hydrolase